MPIYEFKCRACDHHYDDLVSLDFNPADQACPKCAAVSSDKLLSAFSMRVSSGNQTIQLDGACLPGPASSGGAGGGCCGGACGACG